MTERKFTRTNLINGIGTTLVGRYNEDIINGSYETAEWFVFFLLPIFPLTAFKVIDPTLIRIPKHFHPGFLLGAEPEPEFKVYKIPLKKYHVVDGYIGTFIVIGVIALIVVAIKIF